MAITKSNTVHFNNVSLTAGGANQTSTSQDLTAVTEAAIFIKLTNGSTGPTVPAQVQIEYSPDNSNWYSYGGPLIGDTANSAVRSWAGIPIVPGVQRIRLVAGSNTGQAVTVRAEVSTFVQT